GCSTVDVGQENSIDILAVNDLVRSQVIDDRMAVDGHPNAPVGPDATMPENLELEPLSHWHRFSRVVFVPVHHTAARKTWIVSRRIIPNDLPTRVGADAPAHHLDDDTIVPIIVSGSPGFPRE